MKIEYMALSEIGRLPRNAKRHAEEKLAESFDRFGFVSPLILDERTGAIVAGHGRLGSLFKAKADGVPPPERVQRRDDGEWMVPVVRGVSFTDDREAEAYAIADNRLTEAGGWDFPMLQSVLTGFAEEGAGNFAGIGFDESELERIMGMGDADMPAPEKKPKQMECPACGNVFEAPKKKG